MSDKSKKSGGGQPSAQILDVLFAIALGEGFLTAVSDFKPAMVGEDFLSNVVAVQHLARILISFVIIILSWIHFRRQMLDATEYPTGEFVVDILVAMSYLSLFLFVDTPVFFAWIVALIWTLYMLARALSPQGNAAYHAFGFGFVVFFGLIAVSASVNGGDTAEWIRLTLILAGVAAYRPLDRLAGTRLLDTHGR